MLKLRMIAASREAAGGFLRQQKKTWMAGVAAFATLLGACGGGGDGGGDGGGVQPPPPPPAGTTVTGTAAYGLLSDAVVTFYGVDANGAVASSALATARTAADGGYTARVTASGPVVVTITVDAQTRMKDVVTGTSAPAPGGLMLRAAVAGLTSNPIMVTPLTEMAFGIASAATGGLTVGNIDAANSAVSAAMLDGAPVLSTTPIEFSIYRTATVAQQSQAKLLAAIDAAAAGGYSTGPSGAVCAQMSYAERVVCTVGGLRTLVRSGASNSMTFAPEAIYIVMAYEKIDAGLVTYPIDVATYPLGQTASTLGFAAPTTAEKALVAAVSSQAALFGYSPSASPLANTKALFADLRTNIVQVQQGVDIYGVTPLLDRLDADFATNVRPTISGTRAVIVAAYTALGLIDQAQTGSHERASGGVVCSYDPAVLKTDVNVALCRYGLEPEEQILFTATRTAAGELAITTQPLTLVPPPPALPVPPEYEPIFAPYWYGTAFERSTALAPITATFRFTSPPNGASSGSWQGPLYVTATGGRVTADLRAAQSDDWNPTTISGTVKVSGKISDGSGGVALVDATLGSDSEVVIQNGALTTGSPVSAYGTLSLTRLATDRFVYAARATIGRPVFDRSNTVGIPQSIAVTGSISELGAFGLPVPVFNGSIEGHAQGAASFDATQPFSATNTLVVQLQVIGSLSLPNSRVLAVSFAANASQVEPTPTTPHSLSATYGYTTPSGTARINVSGEYDTTSGYSATITTNSGVTAVLSRTESGRVTGTVTANGVETARIEDLTINYSDGTTESLF
jgi:hypothetical protein